MNAGHTIGRFAPTPFGKVWGRIAIILGAALFVATMVVLVPGDTLATGNTYTKDGIDLKIDSSATYNGQPVASATWDLKDLQPGVDKFWDLHDVKPGDYGCNVISIHAKKSAAWACLDFENLQESENGINEPESHLDADLTGELAEGTEFFGWIDDGDGLFEPPQEKVLFGTSTQAASELLNDTTYVIGDSQNGSSCEVNKTKYVGMCWCAGDLTVNPQTGETSCDPTTMGNEAQTDSFTVDVVIRAEPTSQHPSFTCSGEPGNDGCSPGYWKQSQHFKDWQAPYATTTLFSAVFENAFPGKTLLQVLGQGGGGLNALGRQTVAALLNAANGPINYPYTTAEIIAKFNAVYPGGNYDALKNELEPLNTKYCPLGNESEGGHDSWSKKPKDESGGGSSIFSFISRLLGRT